MIAALALAAVFLHPSVTAHVTDPVCSDNGDATYGIYVHNHHPSKTKHPHVWQYPSTGGVTITDMTLPAGMGNRVTVLVPAGTTVEVYAFATIGYGHELIHTTLTADVCATSADAIGGPR